MKIILVHITTDRAIRFSYEMVEGVDGYLTRTNEWNALPLGQRSNTGSKRVAPDANDVH
jgi:hypothetical protein